MSDNVYLAASHCFKRRLVLCGSNTGAARGIDTDRNFGKIRFNQQRVAYNADIRAKAYKLNAELFAAGRSLDKFGQVNGAECVFFYNGVFFAFKSERNVFVKRPSVSAFTQCSTGRYLPSDVLR